MSTTRMVRTGAAAVLIGAGVSQATVLGVSGAMELVAPPADARPDRYTSPDRIRVWNERQGHTLERDLWVDAVAPGEYTWVTDLGDTVIPAGTVVSSHAVHFDSPGREMVQALGSVTFGARILGVVVRGDGGTGPARMDESDFLGTGTLYPDGLSYRGLEFEIDRLWVAGDRRTLTLSLRISAPGDYIRVITAVPAPGAAAVLALAGTFAVRRRR